MADIYIGDRKVNELYVGTQRVYAVDDVDGEGNSPDGYVTIDGEQYPYIKIGDAYWTLENLHCENYEHKICGNDISTYPKKDFGYLYNQNTAFSIALPEGWRIATINDFNKIYEINSKDGLFEYAKKVVRLKIRNSGCLIGSSFDARGANFWCESNKQVYIGYGSNSIHETNGSDNNNGALYCGTYTNKTTAYFSLRACKDA